MFACSSQGEGDNQVCSSTEAIAPSSEGSAHTHKGRRMPGQRPVIIAFQHLISAPTSFIAAPPPARLLISLPVTFISLLLFTLRRTTLNRLKPGKKGTTSCNGASTSRESHHRGRRGPYSLHYSLQHILITYCPTRHCAKKRHPDHDVHLYPPSTAVQP